MKVVDFLPLPWGHRGQNLTLITPSQTLYRELVTDFTLIFGFLFALIGAVNNVLSIGILRRKHHNSRSSHIYLTALGVANCVVLVACLSNRILQYLADASAGSCKFFYFLDGFGKFMSSCLVVAVTVENIASLMYPNHPRTYSWVRPRRALLVTATLVGVTGAFNIHSFWTVKEVESECFFDYENHPELKFIVWVHALVYAILPFLFMIFANVTLLVWIKFYNPAGSYREMSGHTETSIDESSTGLTKQTFPHVTVTTLNGITLVFTFCTLPQTVCYALESLSLCPLSLIEEFLLNDFIGDFLVLFNHSCYLVVYLLVCQYFRAEVCAILEAVGLRRCCCKRRPVVVDDEESSMANDEEQI